MNSKTLYIVILLVIVGIHTAIASPRTNDSDDPSAKWKYIGRTPDMMTFELDENSIKKIKSKYVAKVKITHPAAGYRISRYEIDCSKNKYRVTSEKQYLNKYSFVTDIPTTHNWKKIESDTAPDIIKENVCIDGSK